jgi:ADP-ribosyl-[dinitrogen reductase] hydrolase
MATNKKRSPGELPVFLMLLVIIGTVLAAIADKMIGELLWQWWIIIAISPPLLFLLLATIALKFDEYVRYEETSDADNENITFSSLTRKDRFRGVLLGTCIGDALGLPTEGMSRRKVMKVTGGIWSHRFILNRGMVSDDTDHTVLVSQCLLRSPHSPERFTKRLAWSLRLWLLSLPAGTGLATLRSILKLWIGYSPAKSGVYSAGNGPAMRAAPIGAFFSSDSDMIDGYIRASTAMTHTDPRALTGAKAVAYIAAWCVRDNITQRPSPEAFIDVLEQAGSDDEWRNIIGSIREGIGQNMSVFQFASYMGLEKGVTGYIYHTVPVALYSWYRHFGNFEISLMSVLNCGGDTDTVGAITGALAGISVGAQGLPREWIDGICEWPRGVSLLIKLADRLSACSSSRDSCHPVRYVWPAIVPRNLFFLIIVLLHGVKRLLPL